MPIDYQQTLDLQARQRAWDRKKEYAVAALTGFCSRSAGISPSSRDAAHYAVQAAEELDKLLGERPELETQCRPSMPVEG